MIRQAKFARKFKIAPLNSQGAAKVTRKLGDQVSKIRMKSSGCHMLQASMAVTKVSMPFKINTNLSNMKGDTNFA